MHRLDEMGVPLDAPFGLNQNDVQARFETHTVMGRDTPVTVPEGHCSLVEKAAL